MHPWTATLGAAREQAERDTGFAAGKERQKRKRPVASWDAPAAVIGLYRIT